MPDTNEPWLSPLRVADLRSSRVHEVDIRPSAPVRAALAAALGLLDLRKARLTGRIAPFGKADWRFEGHLGATVVQPCVITLAPVTTRIEIDVERTFLTDIALPPPGSETEMDGDDTTELLGEVIDPGQIMAESLALALPDYPRAAGAESPELNFSEPGLTPLSDQMARPFAGLAALRDKLGGEDPETD